LWKGALRLLAPAVVVGVLAGCGGTVTSTTTTTVSSSSSASGTVQTGVTGPDGVITIPGPVEGQRIPPPAVPASCHYVHSSNGTPLPDPRCTPGATDPRVSPARVAATICRSGYTATVRPPVSYTDALKVRLMRAYGSTGPPASYELDHLIPLEAGGAPAAVANLWPEPYAGPGGARHKDVVENYMHRFACDGRDAGELPALQRAVAADWTQIKTGG
jgi:hypothetical protein